MICMPDFSAASLMNTGSRPRSMGVRSTIVVTPASRAAVSFCTERAIMASRFHFSGYCMAIAGQRTVTCSCMSVKPMSAVSIGPVAV